MTISRRSLLGGIAAAAALPVAAKAAALAPAAKIIEPITSYPPPGAIPAGWFRLVWTAGANSPAGATEWKPKGWGRFMITIPPEMAGCEVRIEAKANNEFLYAQKADEAAYWLESPSPPLLTEPPS
jgi:hypothetical protein